MSKKTPTLTEQIKTLVDRKGNIQIAIANIRTVQSTYQKRLDVAEEALVEALSDAAALDTSAARDKASEARVAKLTVRNDYEQSRQDLDTLPSGIKKIDLQINALTTQKAALERELIANKMPDMDVLKDNAREAVAALSAAICLTSTRNPNFVGVSEVVRQLDKDRTVSSAFHHKYNELESSMEFNLV